MSQRKMWKMVHLLHLYGKPKLSEAALFKAGVDCDPDTTQPLLLAGVIQESSSGKRNSREFQLSSATQKLLQECVIANKRVMGVDMRVDFPHAFVIMPFGEKWSKQVYSRMIKPAAIGAGLKCTRGDGTVRVGDLTTNIWNEILQAGIIIAEISVANVNVFYELGLTHALGKDTMLYKRQGVTLPADFGGAHYYEYNPDRLESEQKLLKRRLSAWAKGYKAAGVKALYHP